MKKSIVYIATLAAFLITGLTSTEGQAWGFKNLTKNKTVICTRAACGSPMIPNKILNVCFPEDNEKSLKDTVKHHPNCTKAFHGTHCTNEDGTAADDRDNYQTQCEAIEKDSTKYSAPTTAAEDEDAGSATGDASDDAGVEPNDDTSAASDDSDASADAAPAPAPVAADPDADLGF